MYGLELRHDWEDKDEFSIYWKQCSGSQKDQLNMSRFSYSMRLWGMVVHMIMSTTIIVRFEVVALWRYSFLSIGLTVL